MLCDGERAQERFHAELTTWLPDALLFPHLEIAAVEGAIPDAEIAAERLAVLHRVAASDEPSVVVINKESFDEPVYAPDALRKTSVKLERGLSMDRDALVRQLVEAGYTDAVQVAQRGEFSVRGGVMDVYSWQQTSPLRTEWFGDEIESLREFEIDQQTSLRSVEKAYLLLGTSEKENSHLRDYLKKSDLTVGIDVTEAGAQVVVSSSSDVERNAADEDYSDAFFASPLDFNEELLSSPALRESAEARVREQLGKWSMTLIGSSCCAKRIRNRTRQESYQ